MYYNQKIPVRDLKELKYKAYEIFGTNRLDNIWDVLDVSLSRIEKDPIQKSLLSVLDNFNRDSGILLNDKFITIGKLKEDLICNKNTAEVFRQKFYNLIESILLDNKELLLDKFKESFSIIEKKKKINKKAND